MFFGRTGQRSAVAASVSAIPKRRQHKVQAAPGQFNMNAPGQDRLDEGSIIEEMVPADPVGINRMNRLIYMRCPVGGPTVDMYANLPWSKFDLGGVADKKIRDMYEAALENLRIEDIMSEVTVEYLVTGRVAASLIFDGSEGIWSDMVIHNPDFLRITPRHFMSAGPKIDWKPSDALKQMVESDDERDRSLLRSIPPKLLSDIQAGDWIPLDPEATPFVARAGAAFDTVGTSFYTRIVPAWAMEQQLLTGTVASIQRRIGGVTLVTMGDETWEPTDAELQNTGQLFINSEADPVNAVVAVRRGTDVQRLESNQGNWSVMQEAQFFMDWKTRALGVSEALLGGEARIESAETARTTFMDTISSLRDLLTRRFIMRGILLPIAKANDFQERTKAELAHRIRVSAAPGRERFILPDLRWHKSLEPVADQQWLDLLERGEEKGIYIPMRMWANAVGVNLDRALAMATDDDKAIRKKMKKLLDERGGTEGAEDAEQRFGNVRGYKNGTLADYTYASRNKPEYTTLEDLPVWNKDGVCFKVTRGDMEQVLQHARRVTGGLTNKGIIEHVVRQSIPGVKGELALYALNRLDGKAVQPDPVVSAALVRQVCQVKPPLDVLAHEVERLTPEADPRSVERSEERVHEITAGIAGNTVLAMQVS